MQHLAPADPAVPTDLVSIVMSVFNEAGSVELALGSALDQTWRSLEVVVVDDGSTDGSADKVEAMAALDQRVRLLRQPRNGGVSRARNVGIEAARGGWLLFLDADDRIEPTHVEGLLTAARPAGGAFSMWRFTDLEGREGPPSAARREPDFRALCRQGNPFPIHACLVRREAVLAAGGFDTELDFAEDWDLWQRLADQGFRPASVQAATAVYRLRPGAATHRSTRAVEHGLRLARRSANDDAATVPFLLTMLGRAVGAGGTLDGVSSHFVPGLLAAVPVGVIARRIYDGMLQGGGLVPATAASQWGTLHRRLDEALTEMARRAAEPEIGGTIVRHIAGHLADALAPTALPLRLAPVLAVRIDLALPPAPIAVEDGFTGLRLYVGDADERGIVVELPAAPPSVSAAAIADAIASAQRGRLVRRFLRREIRRRPTALLMVGRAAIRGRARRALWHAIAAPPKDRARRLRTWVTMTGQRTVPALAAPAEKASRATRGPGDDQAVRWQAWFATENPWGYDSGYEQTKYGHTLEVLGDVRIGSALELACAEGHFTAVLAPRVGELLATDIAERAVQRAEARCREHRNIRYAVVDMRKDALPGRFDLIVCSEVLYYLDGRAELRRVARKIVDHLADGGWFLTTHANLVVDDPDATGFDWRAAFGAKGMAAEFARTPGLVFVRELRTPLYRCCLYRKAPVHAVRRQSPREVLDRAASWPGDPKVAGTINIGGAAVTLRDADGLMRTAHLPILMYHRIADDGPASLAEWRVAPDLFEAQLAYLKRHGFRTIGVDEWTAALSRRDGVLDGRVVVITFDDATVDFATTAWPLLRKYGFGASLFVVADRVGGRAAWDEAHGEPAALLDWDEIARLAAEGVEIGSHATSHSYLNRLGPRALTDELGRSKDTIESRIARPVNTLAYPFGGWDSFVRGAAAQAGYQAGLTTESRPSAWGDDRLTLPRLNVDGRRDLDAFERLLGSPEPAPWPVRLRYALARRRGQRTWR